MLPVPVKADVVLIGGGHAHVAVLKRFGMQPIPGARLTLITRDIETPYSGMLPGLIAGHYSHDEAHIDLRPLARFAGARLIHAEVDGLDLGTNRIRCAGRPPVAFDLASLDIGSRPTMEGIPGAALHALPVKPVDGFLAGLAGAEPRLLAADSARIAVVGGGAGGVELTLSLAHRLSRQLPGGTERIRFHLYADTDTLLPTHNAKVRATLMAALQARGVIISLGEPVVAVEPRHVVLEKRRDGPFNLIIWVTHAGAPAWLGETGLALDQSGFVRVDDTLRSVSHPTIFAAGDIAAMDSARLAKSGVYAVRQGSPLADNIQSALLGGPLRRYRPQRKFLGLISTGNKYAVASRGRLALAGPRVWQLKDWIDRRWMRKYQVLPAMTNRAVEPNVAASAGLMAMRCGGCGAKVGADILARVLARLAPKSRSEVLIGLDRPDDAAVMAAPDGKVLVQTVDFFRAILDDPYLFGRIAANHCLGDIYAMGAEPMAALAVAVMPHGPAEKVEEELFQLMSGAIRSLDEADAALAGGHTGEGLELAFGLTVTGAGEHNRLLRKGGMQPNDCLILTKPLGTGTLFAADMLGKARGRWIEAALATMLQSARAASRCFLAHGATACTDVTGFGLAGHLHEMMRASGTHAELALAAVPALDGAIETLGANIASTLEPENRRVDRWLRFGEDAGARRRLLYDPQTAGGLLGSVPEARAQDCLDALKAAGYRAASIVGRVTGLSTGDPQIVLS